MTHHARNIATMPNIEEACARLLARAKRENEAEELLGTAVSIMHDWQQYPARTVRDAIIIAQKSGDGYAVQMARQVIDQLNDAEQIARNRAAALMSDTSASIARQHRAGLSALALGYAAALGVALALHWGGLF